MDTQKDIKDIKYNKKNNKFDMERLGDLLVWVVQHIRYFAAGALFVAVVVVVGLFMDKDATVSTVQNDGNQTEGFEQNAYPEVNELIQNYYNAYAAGDLATLATLATPISERELGYISLFSQYVDSYQNMIYYTKHGLDTSSYMVNVYVEMKFAGVDTLAPGLDFFYVRTREDGTLYIDNLYSQYNLRNNDNPLDTNVHNLIDEYEQQEDVIALLVDAQSKFETAVAADENLYNMLNVIIPDAISNWMKQLVEQEMQEPSTETPDTEVPSTEGVESETPSIEGAESEAPAEPESEAPVEPESEAPAEQETPDEEQTVLSIPEGTVVTITDSINIRKGMSTESEKVGTAYSGEKVTVIMSYAEGWTKVKWNNETGYIRTDLLVD